MAEDKQPVEAAGAENTNTVNADAEKDVQNVLAELKGEETAKPADSEEKKDTETAGKKEAEPTAKGDSDTVEKQTSETNGAGAATAEDEAAEEAKIIAAAAKLGQEPVKESEPSKESTRGQNRGQNRGPRGRGGKRVNYRDNIKSDLTTGEQTSDPDAIRKQVEFYFSDSNLPMDKFLLEKVGGSKNNPVELSVLHSFKRMRRFQPFSAIVEALKDSEKLELTDDNTCVRRKVPLPESANDPNSVKTFEDKALHKSIYAKGFGKEEPSTQFDIEAFFAQFGPTNAIRLRRTQDKIFKGSVFVEFDTEDTQKAFLALEPKPKWKGDTELLIKSKKQYCDEKVKEIEAGRLQPNKGFNRSRGGHRGGRNDNRDNRDWRERRSDDQKRGFKNRRGNGNRGGRGGHGGNGKGRDIPRNERGVPIIRDTTGDPEFSDDPERYKKAKSASNSKSPEQKKSSPSSTSEATAGQKRAREEDAPASAENGDHPAKKVDSKEG